MDRGERGLEVRFARERLQHAVRRHHQIKAAAVVERQRADVAADEQRAIREPCAFEARPGAREHRRGSIDTNESGAGAGDGNRQSAGAASQLQHGAILRRGETLPEGDVAASHRARVLPVVEGRVLVPALGAVRRGSRFPHGTRMHAGLQF